MKTQWLLLFSFVSFSALADVSFEEKKNRVEFLEELTQGSVSMNIEAFRRELNYEKNGLSLEQRAEHEANLFAEKIKIHVAKAYQTALEDKSSEEAFNIVKENIEQDLTLVAPELQNEVRQIALSALADSQLGGQSTLSRYAELEEVLLSDIQERVEYLNREGEHIELIAENQDHFPSSNKNRDAEKKEYRNKEELLESLVSDRENTRWISTSHMKIDSDEIVEGDTRISLRIKAEFMGIAIEAGPMITFKRNYRTNVSIMAEGLNPVLGADGNFDFLKRDRMGRGIVEGGKQQRRFMIFTCNASLDFESDYTGGGGVSVAGLGANARVTKKFSNSVSLSSRRIFIPESVEGMSLTYKGLTRLCHKDFLRARVTNSMTVSDSLNVMMKNVISSLRFSHPKNRCMTDSHCYNWFNQAAFMQSKKKLFPRCLEDRAEKFRSCYVRGLQGANCPVIENGKRTSSGQFETQCDRGLKCVKYQDAGWLKPSKGKCMPINPRTFMNPYDQVRRQPNVIMVDLVTG